MVLFVSVAGFRVVLICLWFNWFVYWFVISLVWLLWFWVFVYLLKGELVLILLLCWVTCYALRGWWFDCGLLLLLFVLDWVCYCLGCWFAITCVDLCCLVVFCWCCDFCLF